MQGHSESPRLWDKHVDAILCKCGLVATIHKPCLYSGSVQDKRVILKHQVDDFAISAPNKQMANILLDMIDDRLMIPMKRQGFINMYIRIVVLQMQQYIKISCISYITKICEKYLTSWMRNFTSTDDRPTLLPADPTWMKNFNAAMGDQDPKIQAKLAKSIGLSYRSGVGKLIWAMTMCQPDLAYASVKLPLANACPHDLHFQGVKLSLKYLYSTRDDGKYFWHTAPRIKCKEGPIPCINSNKQDLLLNEQPEYDANINHAYAESDWAICVKTPVVWRNIYQISGRYYCI